MMKHLAYDKVGVVPSGRHYLEEPQNALGWDLGGIYDTKEASMWETRSPVSCSDQRLLITSTED